MRRMVIFLALLLILTVRVNAAEVMEQQAEQFGVEELERNLPQAARAYLEEIPTETQDFTEGVTEILTGTLSQSGGYIRASVFLLLRILLILILCRLVETGEYAAVGHAVSLAGVLALAVCCAADLRTMIGLGKRTIDEMMNFSTLLLPVMASAAAASGSATGAGVLYGITAVFSKLLVGFCGRVLIPMVYAYLALGVTDAALQEARLKKLQELLAWLIRWGLKAVMYVFTGFIAVSGLLSGSVDATALKAAKVTISGVVPVVGGIISDAAEAVLYSAGILKSAIGTFGMLAFLAVFAAPFLRMALHYLAFKLTAVFGGILGSSLSGFMECITGAMGFLLAMLGSCVVMCLLSCCCFMRVVGL